MPGKFETAAHSTLFLDEISNLPLHMQSKLLRVLQDKTFYRVGGTKQIMTDVRVLAASNFGLQHLSENKIFRKDLYYRLAEYVLYIPPLRERKRRHHFSGASVHETHQSGTRQKRD